MRQYLPSKKRAALAFCLCLTLAPFLGSYLSAESRIGTVIGNLTPYTHLTMAQEEGLPFAEAFGGLTAMGVILIGLFGFSLFAGSHQRRVGGLLLLLCLTLAYCLLRAGVGVLVSITVLLARDEQAALTVAGTFADFVWACCCYWAIKALVAASAQARAGVSD